MEAFLNINENELYFLNTHNLKRRLGYVMFMHFCIFQKFCLVEIFRNSSNKRCYFACVTFSRDQLMVGLAVKTIDFAFLRLGK